MKTKTLLNGGVFHPTPFENVFVDNVEHLNFDTSSIAEGVGTFTFYNILYRRSHTERMIFHYDRTHQTIKLFETEWGLEYPFIPAEDWS